VSTLQLYDKLTRRSRPDSLQDAMGRHLVELMNCALRGARVDVSPDSPAAFSVLNYGCPPMIGRGTTAIDPAQIAAHIGEAIRRFEPRLDIARTRVLPRAGGPRSKPQTLYFDIGSAARENGAVIQVSLALDILSDFFSLTDD
jgi:type VI secretion system protein ImpF